MEWIFWSGNTQQWLIKNSGFSPNGEDLFGVLGGQNKISSSTTSGGSGSGAEVDASLPNAPLATTDNDDVNNLSTSPVPATSGTLKRQQTSPVSSPAPQDPSSKSLTATTTKNLTTGSTTSTSTTDPSIGNALGEF